MTNSKNNKLPFYLRRALRYYELIEEETTFYSENIFSKEVKSTINERNTESEEPQPITSSQK